MTMRLWKFCTLLGVCTLVCATPSFAKSMSDKVFRSMQQRVVRQILNIQSTADRDTLYSSTVGSIDVDDLRPSQIAWLALHGIIEAGGARTEREALSVANAWARRSDAEGAAAAAVIAKLSITMDTTAEQDAAWMR
ncbi:MAG: hypothetical protein ACF8QF_07655, partial [Phycisphaerales bacterium]